MYFEESELFSLMSNPGMNEKKHLKRVAIKNHKPQNYNS